MTAFPTAKPRVLAIDPITRGLGFAVLESPHRLIDWGVAEVRADKRRQCLRRLGELIRRYEPDLLVIEDYTARDCRRCVRVRRLLRSAASHTARMGVAVHRVSCVAVREAFADSGAVTKQEIAVVIARQFPELAPWLPPVRKPWMSEDSRLSIFDAVALALTFYSRISSGRTISALNGSDTAPFTISFR